MRFSGSLTYCKIALEDFIGVLSRFIKKTFDRTGTAQAGASTTITLDSGANANDDFYNKCYIVITDGTGKGQTRVITDYNGTTKVATVDTEWDTTPDNTSVFRVYSGRFTPYNSNSVGEKIATIESEMNIGRFFKDNIYRGSKHTEGSISGIEIDYENINIFLKALLGKEGTPTQIGTSNVYSRTFTPEEDTLVQLPSLSIELFKKTIYWYTGVFVKSLKLSGEVDGLIKADFEFLGMEELESTNPSADRQSPIYINADKFKYYEGVMSFRGSSSNWNLIYPDNNHYITMPIDSFELSYDNGVEHKNTFKGMETIEANGALQAGSTTTEIVLDATASNEFHIYAGLYLKLTSGTYAGQERLITAYNPLTKTATVSSAFGGAPASATTYDLINKHNNRYPYSIDRQKGEIKLSLKNDLDDLMANIRSEYKNDYDCSAKITLQTTLPIGSDGGVDVYGYLDIDIPRCKIEEYSDDISGTDFIPADITLAGLAPIDGSPAITFTIYSKRATSYNN
ncbi:MAG: phage tail tube protein [Candidatus Woesearchaeota archaeon]